MNERKFNSLSDIKEAFQNKVDNAETIMKGSLVFLRRAVARRDAAVKQFLLDLVKIISPKGISATTSEERTAVRFAISFLGRYKDPNLLPCFMQLLSVADGYYQHETILALVELDDIRAAGPLAALLEEDNSPRDLDFLLNALAATGAAEYLDLIASYLSHDNHIVRIGAITSLLLLGSKTGRKEVLETVMPYLEDPLRDIRIKTAYHINMRFPNEFYDRGLEGYLPEGLRFPRVQEQKQVPQEPERPQKANVYQMALAAAAD